MSSYVTTQQFDALRSTLNRFVAWVNEVKANHEAKFETYKRSINGMVSICLNLQAALKESSPSSDGVSIPTSSVEKINDCITQLNATIDYLESWADIGNLTMKDVRESVGERLSAL